MGRWGVFLGLRIFFLKIFHQKIKSVQNGLKCKKTHNFFSLPYNYYHWPRPESNGPGLEYLDTLGPGRPLSSLGQYSMDQSAFVVVIFPLRKYVPSESRNKPNQFSYNPEAKQEFHVTLY